MSKTFRFAAFTLLCALGVFAVTGTATAAAHPAQVTVAQPACTTCWT